MKLKAAPPIVLKNAATGVAVPKLESWGAPIRVSIKKGESDKYTAGHNKGKILETPFIRCL